MTTKNCSACDSPVEVDLENSRGYTCNNCEYFFYDTDWDYDGNWARMYRETWRFRSMMVRREMANNVDIVRQSVPRWVARMFGL